MIPRHPHHFRKSRIKFFESQFKIGCGFTNVARKDQPIVRTASYTQERPPVGFITEVKITYGIQFHAARPLPWPEAVKLQFIW
jgi:hypothetical protein